VFIAEKDIGDLGPGGKPNEKLHSDTRFCRSPVVGGPIKIGFLRELMARDPTYQDRLRMEQIMQTVAQKRSYFLPMDRERAWPLDARMAMFVLEAGGSGPEFTRDRTEPRQACRLMGTICENNPRSLSHAIVYVRDTTPGHMGFICQTTLTVDSKVVLNCEDAYGETTRILCRVGRSRPYMKGWSEGVLHTSEV
jgi:hypothetical protein